MLIGAVSFFVDQLGWREEKSAHVTGGWGEARFVRLGYARFELSQLEDDKENYGMLPGVHFGLAFADPKGAAEIVEEWASYAGVQCELEEVDPGRKYFVSLPDLFRVQFEFVPFPRAPLQLSL
jgi:hypothetical protein